MVSATGPNSCHSGSCPRFVEDQSGIFPEGFPTPESFRDCGNDIDGTLLIAVLVSAVQLMNVGYLGVHKKRIIIENLPLPLFAKEG